MKKKYYLPFAMIFVLFVLVLVACKVLRSPDSAPKAVEVDTPGTLFVPTIAPTVAKKPASPTLAPTITSTAIVPTVALQPTPVSESRQKIRAIMEEYGKVDEKYLSDTYWEKMSTEIAQYGPAKRILTLEFHGDYYSMYDGSYAMTQESFVDQMDYLMANNYHFVTGPETLGFLEGWLDLPARSIILTTDSGAGSIVSMPRIIAVFQLLEAKYGYTPHMQSFIWTQGMGETESIRCVDDLCWKSFATYRDSGYFSFGSHTEYHRDFGKMSLGETNYDLNMNLTKIKDHLGLSVYSLTWPFETCSPFPDALSKLGIKFAFGGWTRSLNRDFTYQNDDMPLCLPRLFPPNPDGHSGRPNGLTLEQMLNQASNEYLPLH